MDKGGISITLWAIAFLVFTTNHAVGIKKIKRSAERKLYDRLIHYYDPSSRPLINSNSTIKVKFSLMLTQMMDLVEKNQTLITQMTITQEWQDDILKWDPQDHEGLETLTFPSREVWVPDLYVFNNAEKGYDGLLNVNDSRVFVKYTGKVYWSLPLIIKSSCAVDVKYFPFDNQRCSVRIGSWLHDGRHLDIDLKQGGFDMTSYITNDEFKLLSIKLEREVLSKEEFSVSYFNVIPQFSHTSEAAVYPQMVLSLHIKRKPLYYLYTVVAPTLVLCIMMLFSFLLPCESGDKVAIGLTVFLSLYVLQLAIAENIPESNSLPLISLFLTLVMTLNSLSLMFATLVINIKKKGDRKPCQAVPECILWLCHKVLAKITITKQLEFRDFYTTCLDEERLLKRVAVRNPSEDLSALCKVTRGHEIIKSVLEDSTARSRKSFSQSSEGSENMLDAPIMHRERRPSKFASTSSKLLMHNKNRKLEWYFVAEVTDKILFMLFLVALLVTVLTSLWIVPELHKLD